MGIRIDIGLDMDGNHRFDWEASDEPGALAIPEDLLRHWTAEHAALRKAQARWQDTVDEIEEFLLRLDAGRRAG